MQNLKNQKKKVLVIGATSAIAQECIKIWVRREYSLFLVARNKKKFKKVLSSLQNITKKKIHYLNLDINNIDSHLLMLKKVKKELGDIDIVLIASATLSNQQTCQKKVTRMIEEIKNNALSIASLLTHLANFFEKKKNGTLAVISSVAADRGRACNYVYGSAKSLLDTFLSGLRQRLNKSNVNVITIKPAYIDTPMTKKYKKNFLWVKPFAVAIKIIKNIDSNTSNIIYTPSFWRPVMFIIKCIPEFIFKKIKI